MKLLSSVFAALSIITILALAAGCSGEDLNLFQSNDAPPSYELFSLLDDYPSLKEPFSNLDQTEFNQRMAGPVNRDVDLSKVVLGLTADLFGDPAHPITDSLAALRGMLERIIKQDERDDPAETYSGYASDLFGFLDEMSAASPGVGDEIVSILRKNLSYIDYAHGSEIETVMADLISFLRDTDGQNPGTILPLLQEGLAKLLMIANTNIEDGGQDLGLGNAVRGIDALLEGVNDIATGDPAAREALYDVIRSSGELFTATAGGKNFATILKELMINAEDYATEGGSVYSNSDPLIRENYNEDDDYYVNTELRNGIKTLWPGLMQMFIRARGNWDTSGRPDYSPIYDPENGESALEYLTRKLNDLKQNCGIDFATYSLEDSLKRMVEYNALGEPRSSASYKVSYLDHLLYTLAGSNDFGFLTRKAATRGDEPYANNSSDEDTSTPDNNACRLHGTPTGGILTVNDSLYSMTGGGILGTSSQGDIGYFGSYNLSLDVRAVDRSTPLVDGRKVGLATITVNNKNQGDYIYRSSTPFTSSNAGDYKFYMGSDFPTQALLSGAAAGDAGIPNGGRSGITPTSNETIVGDSNNDYRTYYPSVGNGLGELNTGRWVMGWIARATWEGEGPYYYADSNAPTETIGSDNYRRYLRPDGRIYALVNTSTGECFYPVDGGNDVAETDTSYAPLTLGSYQLRQNRYKAQWHTDYYLMKSDYVTYDDDSNHGGPRYYSPASVVGTTGTNKYLMHYLNGTTDQGEYGDDLDAATTDAGCLWFWEKIAENDAARACPSQEEAMYRNYQWLILEKKFVFIQPMRSYMGITATACGSTFTVNVDALIYAIIEGNGIAGMANAKKGTSIGQWVLSGVEGTALGHNQPTSGANYGDSHNLADGRVWVLVKEDASYDKETVIIIPMTEGDYVDINKVWNSVLRNGNVLPNVVGENIEPIARMAFLQPDLVASNSSDIGNASSTTWQNRSKLLPIVAALAGDLHSRSHYEPPAVGNSRPYWYNFTDAEKHRYPLKSLRDMIGMLASPLMRYYKTPYTGAPNGWWVPQMEVASFTIYPDAQNPLSSTSYSGNYGFFAPRPASTNANYMPRSTLRSTAQVLTESGGNDTALTDGLIPALASTGTTTKLMALLQHLGGSTGVYADIDKTSDDYSQWGARRKMFYGLEQIVTSIKTSKSTELSRNYYGVTYPDWMFDVDEDRGDISLDTVLDELVGSDSLAKGLAVFVDYRDSAHANYKTDWDWDNFNKMVTAQGELMSTTGTTTGQYCILEDVISLTDSMLTSFTASPAQLRALRHTLGIIVAEDQDQNDVWEYPDDLNNIILNELPEILEVNAGHNEEFLTFMQYFLEPGGFVEYLVEHMNSSYSFAEIIPELYQFLGDDIIAQPGSELWSDLADLILDLCIVMDNAEPDWFSEFFQNNDANFNRTGQAYPDPYGAMGELLSRHY